LTTNTSVNSTISIIDVWQKITSHLTNKLTKPAYETFINSGKPISFLNKELVVAVSNVFSKNWIIDRCEFFIKQAIKEAYDFDVTLTFKIIEEPEEEDVIDESGFKDEEESRKSFQQSLPIINQSANTQSLNEKYSFNNFISGTFNRFSASAAMAVANAPGKAYNPLFIYGGVGLGKTHLLHAIGLKVKEKNQAANVLYVSAEKFTNDLINSIQHNKMPEFREKYRNIDVLLIDDIQFLSGKGRTEEEFFHTFNTLYEHNKQIVISSDRAPKDILYIQERLQSRFEWGLSADIQPPDLETRIAILKSKAEIDKIVISDEVLNYIATQIPNNIRELEGALIRIAAFASLVNQEITLTLTKDIIKDIVKNSTSKIVSILTVKKMVAKFYDLDVDDLADKKRTKDVAHARQVAMYLARELTNLSLPKIGENFGGRDHTTVMYACDKIKEEMNKNLELKSCINQITSLINEKQ